MHNYKISDICEIIGGNPAPKGENIFGSIGLPFLKMKDLGKYHTTSNLINIENKVSCEDAKQNNLKIIKKGAILLPRSGSVGLNHRAVLGVDAYMVSHVCALEIKDISKVYNLYLYYYLRTIDFKNITKKTTGLDAITFEDLGKLKIPIPPLPEQKRIADILDKADSIRQKRKESIALLDEFLKSVFIDMFGDPVRNEKGWELHFIKDVAVKDKNSIKAGPFGSELKKEFYVSEGYKIYGQEQVIRNNFEYGDYYISDEKYNSLTNYKISPGDILISLVGTFGKISIVPRNIHPGIINPRLMKLTLDQSKINLIFFKFIMSSNSILSKIQNESHGGTLGIINVGIIKALKIPIPPINLQTQFAKVVEQVEATKSKMEESLREMDNQFNGLLQRSFGGN